ncbi:hypothetical protein Golax_012722, partial [Gossypium laxum]|nr:hypothetical protein [Gossypium laxum]
ADTFLWRNKKISAGVLGVATVIWVLFELLESPLCIPEVHIPKNPVIGFAEALRFETNLAFTVFRDIASGRDLKKFLYVCDCWLVDLVYCWKLVQLRDIVLHNIVFVLLHTVPVLYEKYEDKVDPFAEKAMHEIKKQYVVFNANVLSKIPRGPSKEKKKD